MRVGLWVLLFCVAACHQPWREQPPAIAKQVSVRIPAYEHRTMANGAQVYLQQDDYLPLLSISLVVRAGEAAVAQQQSGLMRLLYEMLVADAELERELDQLGATVQLAIQPDAAFISLNVSSADALPALKRITRALREPRFDEASFTRIRTRLLSEVFGQTPSPWQRAEDVLLSRIYGPEHPLALTGRKTLNSLSQLRLDEVTAAYKRFIGPKNVALVLIGRVPKVVGFAWAQKYLGDWSAEVEEPKVAPPLVPKKRSTIPVVPAGGVPGTIVLAGGRLQWQGTAGEAAARTAVRQLATQLALLLQSQGYAAPGTETEAEIEHHSFGAHYVVRTVVRPELTKVALAEIAKQVSGPIVIHISKSADGAAALAQILYQLQLNNWVFHQTRLVGVSSLVHSFRGLPDVGRNAAHLFVRRQPDDYYIQLIDHMNALTEQQVSRAADANFVPEVMHIVLAGDPKLIESQLRDTPLGTVQRILPD